MNSGRVMTWMWVVCVLGGGMTPMRGQAQRPPNIVFFLVDDLGYMDIGANNPKTLYETPNIDRLAATGTRFTSGYAANPVCSPTRFSIMTGKYPSRFDVTNFFSGKRSGRFNPAPLNDRMPLEEVTLAEALKQAGYATAFAGKWHLGPTEEFWPEHQGFDFNFGGWRSGYPRSYFSPYQNPRLKDGPKGEYLPERLVNESIRFIQDYREQPFFLYLSFYSVHTPLQGKNDLIQKYQLRAKMLKQENTDPEFAGEEQVWPGGKPRRVRVRQTHAVYAAMVEAMDQQVGRVLDALNLFGLRDNTAVFFMSDNGGLSTSEGSPTSNLPFRGGKGWLYEGGIREPYLIRWPGVTRPGSVCDEPVISTDFYPTILEMAGLPLKPDQHRDGRSLVALLKDSKATMDREALFWHYPHYSNQGGFPGGAIRMGQYKLVERYEDGRVHLYDLKTDAGETRDLTWRKPEQVLKLRTALHEWYQEVDAKFLMPRKEGHPVPWRPGRGGKRAPR